MRNLIISFFSLLLLLNCTTRTKTGELDYFNNIDQVVAEASANQIKSTIQPGDQISIYVSAKDQKVADIFNQSFTTSDNVRTTSSTQVYLVDGSGNIDFPQLGQLNTTGKTISDFRNELNEEIGRYVINPTINMRLTNFRVNIIGEVGGQGEINIPNGQATILNAIAMAGGVSMYGKRDDITIIRTVDGVITQGKINLQDANLINSPFYHLVQGDYIIVPPNENKEKIAKQNPNLGTYLTAGGLAISVIIAVITLTK